jgi:hypothetical protein
LALRRGCVLASNPRGGTPEAPSNRALSSFQGRRVKVRLKVPPRSARTRVQVVGVDRAWRNLAAAPPTSEATVPARLRARSADPLAHAALGTLRWSRLTGCGRSSLPSSSSCRCWCWPGCAFAGASPLSRGPSSDGRRARQRRPELERASSRQKHVLPPRRLSSSVPAVPAGAPRVRTEPRRTAGDTGR